MMKFLFSSWWSTAVPRPHLGQTDESNSWNEWQMDQRQELAHRYEGSDRTQTVRGRRASFHLIRQKHVQIIDKLLFLSFALIQYHE